MEIDPGYFDISRRRITQALTQGDMFTDISKPIKPTQEAML